MDRTKVKGHVQKQKPKNSGNLASPHLYFLNKNKLFKLWLFTEYMILASILKCQFLHADPQEKFHSVLIAKIFPEELLIFSPYRHYEVCT